MKNGILKEQNRIFKTLAILAIVISIIIKFFVTEPKEEKFRREIENREISRVESIFFKDQNVLKNNLSNHSMWFDLHRAVIKKDISFLKNCFDPIYLATFNLDYIGFFDLSKDELWSVKNAKLYYETGEFVKNKAEDIINLQWDDKLRNYNKVDMIKYNGKSYVYGVHFILDNIKNDKPAGYLIFLREINKKYVQRLSEGTGFKFSLMPEKDMEKIFQETPDNKDFSKERPFIREPRRNLLFHPKPPGERNMFIPFYGLDNTPVFIIKLGLDGMVSKNNALPHLIELILISLIILIIFFTNMRIKTITRPVIKLHKHMENINDFSSLEPVKHEKNSNEIDAVIHSFNKMILMLEKRDLELKSQNCVLEDMVYIDTLTGVGSRRLLQKKIPEDFKDAALKNDLVSIAMIDVDHFKLYNDTYGHIQGDTVLMKIGELLKGTFYDSDFIIRYGGEEFMVFLRGKAAEETSHLINNFVTSLRNEKIEHSKGIDGIVTASVGICSGVPYADDDLEECIKLADLKLYKAKDTGRNKIVFYKKR
jgi:diguanylate cyclase (GGDEF)-like protein